MSEDRLDRVSRLSHAAKERSDTSFAAAQRAITSLDARGKQVTFTTVATEAKVSLSYLYKTEVLADRIRELRGSRRATRSHAEAPSSDKSLLTKLNAAAQRVAQLEAENAQLQRENRSLLSRLMNKP
ncbi:hypothetical protein E3T61_19455 [Cryobacterium lactosi]|uniref:Transposase n=1 Tax=Cryobacterium lactosi TaxID=1259202 RepID=A0A4R9BHB2_9MICO|nr:DUF6262 family protein [Cryobacterium lactosi]TFD84402.1 hypothetical protein E3T61_19455 [Cryobacterium lactosi]